MSEKILEFILSFILGIIISLTLPNQRSNNMYHTIAEILNTKYGESRQIVKTIHEVSIENVQLENPHYIVVIDFLKKRGYNHGTQT